VDTPKVKGIAARCPNMTPERATTSIGVMPHVHMCTFTRCSIHTSNRFSIESDCVRLLYYPRWVVRPHGGGAAVCPPRRVRHAPTVGHPVALAKRGGLCGSFNPSALGLWLA
jgi:hypothetical protein